jgi:spore coat-associated protein N
MSRNSRKVLVPLATLLAAGAVVVGSGASFTSTSTHSVAVTSGNLSHHNNTVSLTTENIKPGDTVTGDVVITNDGSLDSTLSLQETSETSTFVAGDLKLVIKQGASVLYTGDFGGLDNDTLLDLGALDVDDSTTVTFTVSMSPNAGNLNQGKSASASYQWVTTQTAGQSTSFLHL